MRKDTLHTITKVGLGVKCRKEFMTDKNCFQKHDAAIARMEETLGGSRISCVLALTVSEGFHKVHLFL